MPERLKARLLTAVWGERYVREFAQISLPSYLAPGNIPALSENVDLEVVILTTRSSVSAFQTEPAFLRLLSLCQSRFLLIDDLITTGNYGVILTLAYARGIIDAGAEQLNTWFIFMNSDFVLADGGMRNLLPILTTENHAIMSASLRVRAETVLPLLDRYIAESGTQLSMSPREAVGLALANLHGTVIGKTITQDLVTCQTHNQIYWGVDDSTLLARNHLIFMLAIKPETPMRAVNSYCDYGLVPELVPSGRIHVIGDSDTFFMMEMQPSQQETSFLCYGTKSQLEIAEELSGWTTKEHRLYAEHDVIFHAKEIPPFAESTRSEAQRFITDLHGQLRAPKDHADHFYWVRGLEAWFSLRAFSGGGKLPVPPELTLPDTSEKALTPPHHRRAVQSSLKGRYAQLAMQFKSLLGSMPYVSIMHPHWIDARMLLEWVRSQQPGPHGKNLLICEELNPETFRLSQEFGAETITLAGTMTLAKRFRNGTDYVNILIMIDPSHANSVGRIIHELYQLQSFTNRLTIHIRHRSGDLQGNLSNELAQCIADLLPDDWLGYEYTAFSTGGHLKDLLAKSQLRLARILIDFQISRLPKFVLAMALYPITIALTAVHNVWMARRERNCKDYMSSALISMHRLHAATGADRISSEKPGCP
jgi:hypothetical protein